MAKEVIKDEPASVPKEAPKPPAKEEPKAESKEKDGLKKKEPKAPRTKSRRGHISTRERIIFAKHLSVMIQSGLPLREGLAVISQHARGSGKKMFQGIIEEVDNGQFLHIALSRYPKAFNDFFTSMVRVGEESGRLAENLNYLADQIERGEDLRKKVKGALIYPAVVFAGTLGVVGFLSFVTLPQLIPVFSSLRVELPATTKILIASSHFITSQYPFVILGAVALFIFSRVILLSSGIRFLLHRIVLRIPIFGKLIQNAQITSMSRVLATLLTAGVDVVRALEITARSMSNLVYRRELNAIAKNLQGQGEGIAEYLGRHERLFPNIMCRMIHIGEKTGKLDESLVYLSQFYDKEIDNTVRNLTTIIEPVMLLFMGLLVGFVAISIISPIYELTRGLSR